uniref:Legume lectin domain-containing protein n=1 Tax=Kalanchoe fedtschenkoi TaxID=63787 RepID=A0A7N0UB92_KALFE
MCYFHLSNLILHSATTHSDQPCLHLHLPQFSVSNESGDGLAFLMASNWSAFEEFDGSSFGISQILRESRFKVLAVELDTFKDDGDGDLNGNHVGVDVGGLASVKVNNASSVKLVLNSGEKLSCWIDYEAGSKRLEVRVSTFSAQRPVKPLLMYSVDFTRNWNGNKEFYMGFSSSNGNSTQTCFIHSWSFAQRFSPKWMHSEPMDPGVQTVSVTSLPKRSSHCLMRVLAALIFGAACGVLGAYMVMLMWRTVANRRPVTPEELVADPSQFKVIVVRNQAIKDGHK